VGHQDSFLRGLSKKTLHQRIAGGHADFFGEHAQRTWRNDEMDAANSVVLLEGSKHFDCEDRPAGASDGEDEG
jgi:hypothetical protein